MTIPATTIEAIRGLQRHVGEGNRARGFREDEEILDAFIAGIEVPVGDFTLESILSDEALTEHRHEITLGIEWSID